MLPGGESFFACADGNWHFPIGLWLLAGRVFVAAFFRLLPRPSAKFQNVTGHFGVFALAGRHDLRVLLCVIRFATPRSVAARRFVVFAQFKRP